MNNVRCSLFAGALLVPLLSHADGLPDPNFDQSPPSISTEFVHSDEGTNSNPLTITPCIFPGGGGECSANAPDTFSQSNYFASNFSNWGCTVPWGLCPPHWLLIMNNEDAFGKDANGNPVNPGPPGASLSHAWPGYGIFGFDALYDNRPGQGRWRAHMVLNVSSQFPNPSNDKIPYMAFGAWAGRSNPGPVGYINPSSNNRKTILRFGATLWDMIMPDERTKDGKVQDAGVMAAVVAIADWGTHAKAIEIHLGHLGVLFNYGNQQIGARNWNWPIVESVYYPGARFVYVNADSLGTLCGMTVPRIYVGQTIQYSIDLNALFQCVDGLVGITPGGGVEPMFLEPLPSTADIPITSVSWAVEAAGKDGGTWIDVHNMRMGPSGPVVDPNITPINSATVAGSAELMAIQARIRELCRKAAGCVERAQASRNANSALYDPVAPSVVRDAAYETLGITVYKAAKKSDLSGR